MLVPLWQVPFWHVSPLVQLLPSLHGVPFGLLGFAPQVPFEQLPCVWHWSAAGQTVPVPPVHVPFWQVSPVVQPFPSLQVVPLAFKGLEQTPAEHVPATWH